MSGADQFTVKVDPDSLQLAYEGLRRVAEHLSEVSKMTGLIPAGIGEDWTGAAATVMKAELVGLSTQSAVFHGKFEEAARALQTFADAARKFQDVTIPAFRRSWDSAEADAKDANDKAERVYNAAVKEAASLRDPELGATAQAQATALRNRAAALGQAATERRYMTQSAEADFSEAKWELGQKAKAAGDAMARLTVVIVPDSVAKDAISRYHATTHTLLWGGPTFPPDLGTDDALAGVGMTLVRDKHDWADGERAALEFNQRFQTGPKNKDELDAYLKTLKVDSAAYRQAFLAGMDPAVLAFMQMAARTGVDPDTGMKYGEVITAVSQIMAKASNAKTQGDYPVPPSFYDKLRSQYKSRIPPEQGYLLLAEIVQAGQAEQGTWDPALLTDITKDTIDLERKLHETNSHFYWGSVFGNTNGVLPTEAGRAVTGIPGRVDAVGMLLDLVGDDADVIQDLFRGPDGNADLTRLHYLYDGRNYVATYPKEWAKVFGNMLETASTHHRGSGGPGTRDYVSAQIASDLVNYVGENPDERLMPGMEQNVVDILSVHMDAVNHFTADHLASGQSVGLGEADDPLPWNRDTHANFFSGRLDALMTAVFANDYETVKAEADVPSGKNPHPLLSQFTLAQQAMWQQGITYGASHLKDHHGLLKDLARRHGWSSNATITSFATAMKDKGGEEEAARASARETADFVLGFGLDKIAGKVPGGPALGLPKLVAGAALEALKSSAIDHWLPVVDAEARMQKVGAALSAKNFETGSLAYLKWLDQPGHGPTGAASYDSWATTQQDHQDFLTQESDGHWHIKDPGQIYLAKDTPGGQKAWEDFVKYSNDAGLLWLMDQDLYQGFALGVGSPR